MKVKRYNDVTAHADPKAKVRERVARHERTKGSYPDNVRLRAFMMQKVCVDGAKYYEALVGAGDRAGAAAVGALLAGFDPAEAYPALIAAAKRVGDDGAAEALAVEARKASET